MDFPEEIIELRYFADEWGPFSWNLADMIPSGRTIASANIRTFLGKVNPTESLDDQTETTDDIVDSVSASSTYVYGYFQWLKAAEGTHTVIIEATLDDGAKQAFYFYGIRVC